MGLLLASPHGAPDWFPFLPPWLALRMGAAFFMDGRTVVLEWESLALNEYSGETFAC